MEDSILVGLVVCNKGMVVVNQAPFIFPFLLTHCLNMEMYERLVVLLLRCIVGFGRLLSGVCG